MGALKVTDGFFAEKSVFPYTCSMFCRVCDSTDFVPAIDLGVHPLSLHFLSEAQVGKEAFYPLRVVVCEKCQAAQLDYTVKKEVMYSDHTYLSGITRSLAAHFEQIARTVDERFCAGKQQKSVLDIGSNDGTQLKAYQALGYEVLGVEAAKSIAAIANRDGVPTLHAFFNMESANRIGKKFDVFNAAGVFFHLEELHSVTAAIQKYLKPDGVFVVQFLYMKSIMENRAFDQIYHEHLLYYTLKTIDTLLARHGLALFDAEFSSIHGGTIIGYVGHKGRVPTERLHRMKAEEEASGCNEIAAYKAFAQNIERLKEENIAFLTQKKREGKRIFGMGAPVKGNTLLNYFGIGKQFLDCLIEKNELRRGLFSPGMHLPIHIEKEIAPPDVYYVLAWNFKKEILQNNQHLIEKGVEFYFPVEPKR
jgi:SAM-dependent methyltransferase